MQGAELAGGDGGNVEGYESCLVGGFADEPERGVIVEGAGGRGVGGEVGGGYDVVSGWEAPFDRGGGCGDQSQKRGQGEGGELHVGDCSSRLVGQGGTRC